jgi:hypothetical protein
MIEVRLQILIGDREILDGHLWRNEAAPITVFHVSAQLEILRQRAEMTPRPVAARTADAGPRLERAHLPIGHGGIADGVPDGDGFARQALQESAVHGALELIHHLRVGEVRLRVAIRSTLQCHDL